MAKQLKDLTRLTSIHQQNLSPRASSASANSSSAGLSADSFYYIFKFVWETQIFVEVRSRSHNSKPFPSFFFIMLGKNDAQVLSTKKSVK